MRATSVQRTVALPHPEEWRIEPPDRLPLAGPRRNGRYPLFMAQATKLTDSEIERRRAAASRLRGLFADVAPGESLVDELIADRRAEARAEGREGKAVRRARG